MSIFHTQNIGVAKGFNSKEQASQYAVQNGLERYRPYKVNAGDFVLRSNFYPATYVSI